MEIKNDNIVDDVLIEEDLSVLDDTTDWKAKAAEIEQKRREDGIKTRERTKALRDQLAELKSAPPPIKKDGPDESALLLKLERISLRQAEITHPDDVELARATAKKWGVDLDEVLADDDFKVKLERQQTTRTNALATSNIRGGAGATQAKLTPEYWKAKGVPPSRTDVPDRKTRAKIVRAMMADADGSGTKFYNE